MPFYFLRRWARKDFMYLRTSGATVIGFGLCGLSVLEEVMFSVTSSETACTNMACRIRRSCLSNCFLVCPRFRHTDIAIPMITNEKGSAPIIESDCSAANPMSEDEELRTAAVTAPVIAAQVSRTQREGSGLPAVESIEMT